MKYRSDEEFLIEVVRLLRAYKVNKVKIQLYDIQIEGMEEVLKTNKLTTVEDEKDCIEGMSLQAQKPNDMPIHRSNMFRSSTERAALDYVTEMFWHADKGSLERRMDDIRSRTYRLSMEVRQVDAMLEVLNKEQRFIVEQLYIEGCHWQEVSDQFSLTYKVSYAMNTFYAWRDKALDLMRSVLQSCC